MGYVIREIEEKDDKNIEYVIRYCLKEYGADHEGTAWADPQLGEFSSVYNIEGRKYWVVETEDGRIVGGAGIGEAEGSPGVCELQKMYCLPEARGTGVSHKLMEKALAYAKNYYDKCYLETFSNMIPAHSSGSALCLDTLGSYT